MNINGLLSWIELRDLILELANPTDSALQYFLYKHSLLRMYTLIVAFLKFAVNINVLYVEHTKVLENFIFRPTEKHLFSSFI